MKGSETTPIDAAIVAVPKTACSGAVMLAETGLLDRCESQRTTTATDCDTPLRQGINCHLIEARQQFLHQIR
jgi:hypothetical protein